jgi:NAD+ diphosphatase
MVGFMARYAEGEVRADQQEPDDAAWFRIDNLPELLSSVSLARQIITMWVVSHDKS